MTSPGDPAAVGGWRNVELHSTIRASGEVEIALVRTVDPPGPFASSYSHTIGLEKTVQPDVIKAFSKRATGEKILIAPWLNAEIAE